MAVVALAAALGPARPSRPVLKETDPAGVEPWAETLLFGGAADVRKLLDGGFDPNSLPKRAGSRP